MSWTQVHVEIDDFEIAFEDWCMDLSCCLILSCPEKTKERRREEEERQKAAPCDPRRGVKDSA